MATLRPFSKPTPPQEPNCPECEEIDSATQRTISLERNRYCLQLSSWAGEVTKSEQNFDGLCNQYENRKCLFVWTQTNYHIYRNLFICLDTELLQTSESIKESITSYVKLNADLSVLLKNIFKSAKDIKTKFADLRDMACKLENCRDDSCNSNQWAILTGKNADNCKGDNTTPSERPEACTDAVDIFDDLICMPKSLAFDIDSIFKASSEVIGIQVFSNISSLDSLQKTFSDYSKEFDKLVQDSMKLRESDMKKLQDELVKSVQETTKSAITRFRKRSDFEGLKSTLEYICCPPCECVKTDGNCIPRLKGCECELCDICDEVKETFCKKAEEEPEHSHAAY